MSAGGDIEGIEFESEVSPGSSVELNPEWVAWLESEPVPVSVEGVDHSITHGAQGSALA